MNLIPINLYTPIYYQILLIVILLTFLHSLSTALGTSNNIKFVRSFGLLLVIFVLLYMGLRPIHSVFTDMVTYARRFELLQRGSNDITFNDPIFGSIMLFSAQIISSKLFFFLCTLIYVIPLYIVCKKWFQSLWFYAFLFLVGSFSFWAYGVNGIRNGMAGSIFLLGISREKRIYQTIWILLAIGIHFSMILPTLGFVLSNLYNHPKKFMLFWVFTIPLSFFASGFWENLFASLNIEDQRLSYLTTEASSTKFSGIGFRWDFLLYSATAVFAGWYYVVKKKYNDKIYYWLINIYLFANAFWILVIRANFSNRFAYLSWFLMALIIVYPLLKTHLFNNQHRLIGKILLLYYSITYLLYFLLK